MSLLSDLSKSSAHYSVCSRIVILLMRLICLVNVILSFAGVLSKEVSLSLKYSGISNDPKELTQFSSFCDGVTLFVSIIAVCANARSKRFFLILPLCSWDVTRLFFAIMCIAYGRPDSEISSHDKFLLYLFVVFLVISVSVEFYCLNLSSFEDEEMPNTILPESGILNSSNYRHFTPNLATTTMSEECEVQFYATFPSSSPPPYSSLLDVEPPSYSSLKVSSARSPGRPAAPGRPVGATFSFVDLPPPYDYQECSENPSSFSRSREQPINPDVSTHM